MTEDETFTLCPYCGERVDPDGDGVAYAVEQREIVTMGPTHNVVNGIGGWFHAACPPEAVGYARRDRPQPAR